MMWIEQVIGKLPPVAIDQVNGIRSLDVKDSLTTAIAILVARYNGSDLADICEREYVKVFGGSAPNMATQIAFSAKQRKILNLHGIEHEFKLDTQHGGYDTPLFNKLMLAGAIVSQDAHTYMKYEQKVLSDGMAPEGVVEIVKIVALLNAATNILNFLDF